MTTGGVPTISVVIPAYNYAQYLPAALESVITQTMPPSEILVVDDGSTDDTADVAETYADRGVRLVRKANGGLAAARNSGAAVATGEYLAFLDADDQWLPAKLDLQVRYFEEHAGIGLVHCGAQEVDADGVVLRTRLDGRDGWVARDMLLFRGPAVLLAGSTMLVPRRVFDDVGGFDGALRHSEDWDFCYRVACRYPIGFVREALVRYRLHGTNMHLNVRAMERAMLAAYGKAFATPAPVARGLRRRAYGNLHTVLAGSFFAAGAWLPFLRHAARALVLTPGNVMRFLGYPARRLARRAER